MWIQDEREVWSSYNHALIQSAVLELLILEEKNSKIEDFIERGLQTQVVNLDGQEARCYQ